MKPTKVPTVSKKVAVYIRFGSESKGFVLPDQREEFKKYMGKKVKK